MITVNQEISPFQAALGATLTQAAPLVYQHLMMQEKQTSYHGFIDKIWVHGNFGRIVAWLLHLESNPDKNSETRFELHHKLIQSPGQTLMIWHRVHSYTSRITSEIRSISGIGLLRWDAKREVLVDTIGQKNWLEVELVPTVSAGAVIMNSKRQWIRLRKRLIPLPPFLFGKAQTREWVDAKEYLRLSLAISHPFFGDLAGYEAVFTRLEHESFKEEIASLGQGL